MWFFDQFQHDPVGIAHIDDFESIDRTTHGLLHELDNVAIVLTCQPPTARSPTPAGSQGASRQRRTWSR